MNRAERRKIGVNLSQEEKMKKIVDATIEARKFDIEQKMMKSSFITMNTFYALVLNSEFGFGTERINRVIERVKLQIDCLRDEKITGLTPKDIQEWCDEKKIKYYDI